ncbi:hypothetical protein [Bacillus sp. EB106-08-02-XG196]|nr:hypothetical protein [Bacillus sp. EB106-08-02-XG196]
MDQPLTLHWRYRLFPTAITYYFFEAYSDAFQEILVDVKDEGI